MHLKSLQTLSLPPTADMHVHLRQGAMMEFVAGQIRAGGVDTVFVSFEVLSFEICFSVLMFDVWLLTSKRMRGLHFGRRRGGANEMGWDGMRKLPTSVTG